MESDFADLLNTSVVVSTGPTSRDVYGTATYSTSAGSTYAARYVRERAEVRTSNGEVVAQVGVLWIDSTATFSTECRIQLGSATGPAHPIVEVTEYPDETGATHHVRVRLGHARGR